MDGTSMAVGAVSDLRHIKHAITTARLVMERTQHSMLAGLQATQFAMDMGLPVENLTTEDSAAAYKKWCAGRMWRSQGVRTYAEGHSAARRRLQAPVRLPMPL